MLVSHPIGPDQPFGECWRRTDAGRPKVRLIAVREAIDNSYVSRMVNLTIQAPNIVAAILDDAPPNHITLFNLAIDLPALWDEQRKLLETGR